MHFKIEEKAFRQLLRVLWAKKYIRSLCTRENVIYWRK